MRRLKCRYPVLLILSSLPFLNGCYIAHVISGQADILRRSIPVEEALKRDDLSRDDKAKLRYIQEVRAFAESELGLKKSKNYTTYYVGPKRPLNWVVTAAYKDRLEPKTWWFPIVGRVSHRGYFDRDEAEKERARLEKEGYDTNLRPALAYSTLGYFTDPITPLMLDLDRGHLASLIIHELTHGTLYVSSQTAFSESLAVFVEREGARRFLAGKFGSMSAEVAAYDDRVHDGKLYDGFLNDAAKRLSTMYSAKPPDLESARRVFFNRMREDFDRLRQRFKTDAYRRSELKNLNNASLIGHLVYADTAPFERAFAAAGRDWIRFWDLVRTAAKHEDPMGRLRELAR
jgi:predicted aminopeptidase